MIMNYYIIFFLGFLFGIYAIWGWQRYFGKRQQERDAIDKELAHIDEKLEILRSRSELAQAYGVTQKKLLFSIQLLTNLNALGSFIVLDELVLKDKSFGDATLGVDANNLRLVKNALEIALTQGYLSETETTRAKIALNALTPSAHSARLH